MGMGMSLGLGISMTLRLECVCCGQSMDEHTEECPQGRIDKLLDNRQLARCCKCSGRSRFVEVNQEDFWECRNCHTQYSSSGVCDGHDPDKLERVILLTTKDEVLDVAVLPTKGSGKFKIDMMLEPLIKLRNKFRRAAARKKK